MKTIQIILTVSVPEETKESHLWGLTQSVAEGKLRSAQSDFKAMYGGDKVPVVTDYTWKPVEAGQ